MRGGRVLIVTGEPPEHDSRLRFFDATYRSAGYDIDWFEIPPLEDWPFRWPDLWRAAVGALQLLRPSSLGAARRALACDSAARPYRGVFGGSAKAESGAARPLASTLRAVARFLPREARRLGASWHLAEQAAFGRFDVLHLADLDALILSLGCRRPPGQTVVYDSHEFQPFRLAIRTRLESALLAALEHHLIARADLTVVVSEPIAEAYAAIHGALRHLVLPNAFFEAAHDRLAPQPESRRTAVLYFGSVQRARGLGYLLALCRQCPAIDAHLFVVQPAETARRMLTGLSNLPIPGNVYVHPLANGHVGTDRLPADYGAFYSLCAIEDVCLSYRYAMPNKYFQSLALGLPMLTVAGSHVGRLILAGGVGLALKAENDAIVLADGGAPSSEELVSRYPALAAAVRALAERPGAIPTPATLGADYLAALQAVRG